MNELYYYCYPDGQSQIVRYTNIRIRLGKSCRLIEFNCATPRQTVTVSRTECDQKRAKISTRLTPSVTTPREPRHQRVRSVWQEGSQAF